MAAWMPASRKKYRSIRQLLMFPGERRGWHLGQAGLPRDWRLKPCGEWVDGQPSRPVLPVSPHQMFFLGFKTQRPQRKGTLQPERQTSRSRKEPGGLSSTRIPF